MRSKDGNLRRENISETVSPPQKKNTLLEKAMKGFGTKDRIFTSANGL